jgi:cytochrome bd-type quinol oxidase subunit 1
MLILIPFSFIRAVKASLVNWLVNEAKEQPKTVQGILRHEDICTTLGLYTQSDMDQMRQAQGLYLNAMGTVLDAIA